MIITGKKFSKPELSRVINGDKELSTAGPNSDKKRLDLLLTEKHPAYNRSTIQKFIKQGFASVDGKTVQKPNFLVEKSAEITLNVPETEKILPKIPVIYEDEHVLVVNKPAGLLSMAKGEYCPEPTLEDYGLLVHRLDRATSGVMILAKDEETQKFLRKQFQDRKCHKTYYAIVEGRSKHPEANIDLPLARNLNRPTTFKVDPSGKPAQTYYKVIKSSSDFSLLELKPTTGRTHQLRVHLAYLGAPILGDEVYGRNSLLHENACDQRGAHSEASPVTTGASERFSCNRLFLHAAALEITLPGGARKTFVADLPEEFNDVF